VGRSRDGKNMGKGEAGRELVGLRRVLKKEDSPNYRLILKEGRVKGIKGKRTSESCDL